MSKMEITALSLDRSKWGGWKSAGGQTGDYIHIKPSSVAQLKSATPITIPIQAKTHIKPN